MHIQKRILFIIVLMVSVALIFTGCDGKEEINNAVSENNNGDASGTGDAFDKEIIFVIPSNPGGSMDRAMRILSIELERQGVKNRVINKPGGQGAEGALWVLEQPADGYTVLEISPLNFIFLPRTRDVGFILTEDFAPIASWCGSDHLFAIRNDSPWSSVDDMVKHGKDNLVFIGSSGAGTDSEYACHKFGKATGIKYEYLPLEHGADALTALIGEHIDIAFGSSALFSQVIESGDVKPFVHVSSRVNRLANWPDVPGVVELGLDVPHEHFQGLFVHKDTPPEIRKKLMNAIQEACKSENMISDHAEMGLWVQFISPDETLEIISKIESEILPSVLEMNK